MLCVARPPAPQSLIALSPPISDDPSHCHSKNENEQVGVPVSPALNFTYGGAQGMGERQGELDGKKGLNPRAISTLYLQISHKARKGIIISPILQVCKRTPRNGAPSPTGHPARIPALPSSKTHSSLLELHPPKVGSQALHLPWGPICSCPHNPIPPILSSQAGPGLTCRGTPTLLATSRIRASETAFEA